jgi:amino acid transporter
MTTNRTSLHSGRLAAGSLGLAESVIMGVAGTAPAFSVAATTAALVFAVGVLAPASLLYCGLIMFGTAFAFQHLNKGDPNAGASYAWVSQAFGPVLGFFAGWSVLIAQAVSMVSGTLPAATATLFLLAPSYSTNVTAVSLVAATWLIIISAITIKGIKLASYVQVALTTVELALLIIIMVTALARFWDHPAHSFSLTWFSGLQFTPKMFATGALTAIFMYWGWDVALNLNEETRDAHLTPGVAAVVSMITLLLLFVGFSVAALLCLTDAEIAAAGTNVVQAVADKLFPRPWSYIAVLSVMLSTIGTLEAAILAFTRTMYAKSRGKALHDRYARLHHKWQTPWIASITLLAISLTLVLTESYLPTVGTVMRDAVNTVGFQGALYYGLASFACAWGNRSVIRKGRPLEVLLYVVWPVVSALFLGFVAIYSIPTFDLATNLIGLGGILLGVVPLFMNRRRLAMAALENREARGTVIQ